MKHVNKEVRKEKHRKKDHCNRLDALNDKEYIGRVSPKHFIRIMNNMTDRSQQA